MRLKDRETLIIDYLRDMKEATVKELCSELYVSEPTVRRALSALSSQGLIIRTHGGAIYRGEPGENLPLSYREREHSEAKITIAKKCLTLIENADTIMVDGSSSALALLKILAPSKPLCVITNSAKAALILNDNNIKTFVTGGELDRESCCYVGSYAENFLRSFSADLCFFSVRTLSLSGKLTDNAIAENGVRRVMIENSKKSCLMLDSGKIGDPCLNTLSGIDAIEYIISEKDISNYFPGHNLKFI